MQVRLPLGALRCEFCTADHPKEMIEVFEKPDAACCQRLRNDLTSLGHLLVEHDPRWLTVLNAGLGQRPYLLLDRSSDGNLCGYLPLALVSGRLFGSFLVSLPYLNHCGVVSNNAKTRMALIDAAVKLADRLDVQYLELRHINPVPSDQLAVQRDDKPLMILDLPSGKKDLWSVIGSKVRNQIRKGQKKDLSIVWGGQELIGEFYNVFAINMRDLGTPVYPRRLFSLMMTQFKQEAEVAVVRYGDRPVAGALLITMGGRHRCRQPVACGVMRRPAPTCGCTINFCAGRLIAAVGGLILADPVRVRVPIDLRNSGVPSHWQRCGNTMFGAVTLILYAPTVRNLKGVLLSGSGCQYG